MRTSAKPLTRRQVAIHEAGHCTIAIACGMIILGAHITDDGDGRSDLAEVSSGKPCPLIAGLVAWGGSAAVGVDWIGEDDAAPFAEFGFADASVITLEHLAEQLVRRFRRAIVAVARELDRRGSLPGVTIRRLAYAACPMLRHEAVKVPRGMTRKVRAALAGGAI